MSNPRLTTITTSRLLTPLTLAMAGALVLPTISQAEIVEIPAEEMTESYIRDTTVIVRKQAPTQENARRTLIRVSPLEDDFSEGESTAEAAQLQRIEYEAMPDDNTAQLQYEFQRISATQYAAPDYDHDRYANDDNLRRLLGLADDEPIDYANLRYPLTSVDGETPPEGMNLTPETFQIVIPNTGNYRNDSYSTQNGEMGVTVTPENITFEMTLPGR